MRFCGEKIWIFEIPRRYCYTDSILLRKIWEQGGILTLDTQGTRPHPRKTVAFPKVWQLYRLGFDFGVRMWYSEEKEGSAPGRLRFWLITASRLRPLAVISYFLSLKYERAAITVPATVATHVTNPTTNSAVIRKPPSIQYSD